MSSDQPMRRMPRQQRSQRRVDVILDAAAQLVTEVGYEALTTSAVALRADTSIGSLYQFFPNKDALLHALAVRYIEDMRQLSGRLFTPDIEYVPLQVLVERTVTVIIEFDTTHPGFNLIFNSAWISTELQTAADAIRAQIVSDLQRIIALKAPHMTETDRFVSAEVMMSMIRGVLPLTQTGDAAYRVQVVREFKRAALAYMHALTQEK
jgi:AcrR family transcriptional regulator